MIRDNILHTAISFNNNILVSSSLTWLSFEHIVLSPIYNTSITTE